MVRALVRLLRPLYGKGSDDNDDSLDFVLSKHEDKVDVLWDALKDMLYLLETFGKTKLIELVYNLTFTEFSFKVLMVLHTVHLSTHVSYKQRRPVLKCPSSR